MSKNIVLISGCDMGSIKRGKAATYFFNGCIYKTEKVVLDYIVTGGVVVLETSDTVYTTHLDVV